MRVIAAVVLSIVTGAAAVPAADDPEPTPTSSVWVSEPDTFPIDPMARLFPIEWVTVDEGDCSYTVWFFYSPRGPVVVAGESTCTDVAPDEEEDW